MGADPSACALMICAWLLRRGRPRSTGARRHYEMSPLDLALSDPETPSGSVVSAPIRVALVGNPNSGKTAMFNALTGARQKVANYAGVTVERKEGELDRAGWTAHKDFGSPRHLFRGRAALMRR